MAFLLSCDNLVDWSLWGHAIQATFQVFLKHSSLFLLEIIQMFFKIVLLIYKLLNLLAMQINWLVIICGCNKNFNSFLKHCKALRKKLDLAFRTPDIFYGKLGTNSSDILRNSR